MDGGSSNETRRSAKASEHGDIDGPPQTLTQTAQEKDRRDTCPGRELPHVVRQSECCTSGKTSQVGNGHKCASRRRQKYRCRQSCFLSGNDRQACTTGRY